MVAAHPNSSTVWSRRFSVTRTTPVIRCSKPSVRVAPCSFARRPS